MSILNRFAETAEQTRAAALQKYRAMIEADDADIIELQAVMATLGLTQADLAADIAVRQRVAQLKKALRSTEQKQKDTDERAKIIESNTMKLRENLKSWIDTIPWQTLESLHSVLAPNWSSGMCARHQEYANALHWSFATANQAVAAERDARMALQTIARENPRLFDNVTDAE